MALALNQAFDRLHLAVDNERRFTADASHELRTPLATISAEIEWALSRERSTDEYRRCLDTAQRAAERMRQVVERLLMLARADSAEMLLQRAPVGLAPVVSDALGIVQPLAEQKHGSASIRASSAATVVGDRDRLTDLVTNLCSNAIQYNRDGGQVSVEVWPEGNEACLRVRDTGIGISADDLPRIFERFYRADKARTAHSGGAGLGLAIAKWIVEAHGGRIACQSTLGQGTEILVRLPRALSVIGCSSRSSRVTSIVQRDERSSSLHGRRVGPTEIDARPRQQRHRIVAPARAQQRQVTRHGIRSPRPVAGARRSCIRRAVDAKQVAYW